MAWTGDMRRFYFESPLVRLMGDHRYEDVFVDGDDLVAASRADQAVPYRSIVIYRYYDDASKDFGNGKTPAIETFAQGLDQLILRLRDRVCANPNNAMTPADFKVYLVAHSMGRAGLPRLPAEPQAGLGRGARGGRQALHLCHAHNGIDMRIVRNVPGWLSFGDVNNFNRERMAGYMAVPKGDDVSLVTNFPPERVFNLVGTNARDYAWRAASRHGPRAMPAMAWCASRTPPPTGWRPTERTSDRHAPSSIAAIRGTTASSTLKRATRTSRASCSVSCAPTASSTSTTSRCRRRCRRRSTPARA
jgi:hypothetical protein